MRITVLEAGKTVSYAACGMPYYLAGVTDDVTSLQSTPAGAVRDETFFDKVKDIQVRTCTRAISIDRVAKTVLAIDLNSGEQKAFRYGKLVLATGAVPIVPAIEGTGLKRVLALRHLDDAEQIRRLIDDMAVDRATIIGGGRIALEVADAMMAQAVDCTIIEMADHLLPTSLDSEMAGLVECALRDKGIQVMPRTQAHRIEGDANGVARKVITEAGEVKTDLVLVAIGVRPNVELAERAGLELGETGAIAVNEYLQTSDPDIYAGGDCVECLHVVTGKPTFAPLGSTANRHGRVIGDNLTGGRTRFSGTAGTGILRTMGLNVAGTGLTESRAAALGYRAIGGTASGHDRSHFYPGGKTITVKIVADAGNGRVLGGQAVGRGDTCRAIDVLASALTFGASVSQVADLDLAYAPPYGGPISSVSHAANVVRNKMDGLANTMGVAEIRENLAQGKELLFLDVRGPIEVEKSPFTLGQVLAIPLGELRSRVGDVPRDKQVVCICPLGIRAYEASRMLVAAGLDDARFIEGGMVCWS